MRTITICLSVCFAAHAAGPSFLFDPAPVDRNVFPLVEQYFGRGDFLGVRLLAADTNLDSKVDREHRIEFASGLANLDTLLQRGCGPETPGTLLYLMRESGSEPAHPVQSVTSAIEKLRASGCHPVAISPSYQFWGYRNACTFDLAESAYQQVDWTKIDLLTIGAGSPLRADCKTGVADFASLIGTIARFVRGKNPRIAIYAHVTFRFTPPAMMIDAMQALGGAVDGFLLSYPLYGDHLYSTAANLETVLKAFRHRQ